MERLKRPVKLKLTEQGDVSWARPEMSPGMIPGTFGGQWIVTITDVPKDVFIGDVKRAYAASEKGHYPPRTDTLPWGAIA